MRRIPLIACGLWLSLSLSARAGDEWTTVAAVGEVTVRIHWVTLPELLAAARRVGKRPDAKPSGFSVLRKNVETGSYSCDVYVPARPSRVVDKATASLGHELVHCFGFSHE